MEVVVTTGAIRRAKLQSNHHHQQTNIQHFYRPDALPVAQPTVSENWREEIKELSNKAQNQQQQQKALSIVVIMENLIITYQGLIEAAWHWPSVLSRWLPECIPCAWLATESWTRGGTSACTPWWTRYEYGQTHGSPDWTRPSQCHLVIPVRRFQTYQVDSQSPDYFSPCNWRACWPSG